jgi:hypothetical protein
LELELLRVLASEFPSNCASLWGLNCPHSDYKTQKKAAALKKTVMPSPGDTKLCKKSALTARE